MLPSNKHFIVVFTCALLLCCWNLSSSEIPPKVLLIGFDGMRWDYISPQRTPFIWSVAQNGVFAPRGILNQMFTVTAANFFSISTGLYEENHGIIGNTFYDPVFKAYYDYWNFSGNSTIAQGSRDARWYTGDPIWQTNDRFGNGRSSGAMRWPQCDAKVNNLTMAKCVPFGGYLSFDEWKQEIDNLTTWFSQPNPINLGLFYNPHPDHVEHGGDIYRKEVVDMIMQLDNLTRYLFEQLAQKNLLDQMNIIMTADHGHTNVYRDYNMLTIDDIIGRSSDDVIISQLSLFPRTDKDVSISDIYNSALKYRNENPKFDVYMKDDLPDEWHYKKSRCVGPVVLMEKLGYKITTNASLHTYVHKVFGMHGYSKHYPEMRPFFVAVGPKFKQGYMLPLETNIETVDIYPLMAFLLNINTPTVDGKLDRIRMILRDSPSSSTASPSSPNTSPSAAVTNTITPREIFVVILAILLLITT